MEASLVKRYWVITGIEGCEPFFERRLPEKTLSKRVVEQILIRLACRHLSENEIVNGSLRLSSPEHTSRLLVERSGDGRFGLRTAGDPYYTALIEERPA